MPIYEYDCASCGAYFEYFLRSASDMPSCPRCGGRELNKRISPFGFSTGAARGSGSSRCAGCSGGNCGSCSH